MYNVQVGGGSSVQSSIGCFTGDMSIRFSSDGEASHSNSFVGEEKHGGFPSSLLPSSTSSKPVIFPNSHSSSVNGLKKRRFIRACARLFAARSRDNRLSAR
eukprot:18380_1